LEVEDNLFQPDYLLRLTDIGRRVPANAHQVA